LGKLWIVDLLQRSGVFVTATQLSRKSGRRDRLIILSGLGRGRRVRRIHRFIAADIDLPIEVVGMFFELLLELLVGSAGVSRRRRSLLFVVIHRSVILNANTNL
jgi:hypothetical protein